MRTLLGALALGLTVQAAGAGELTSTDLDTSFQTVTPSVGVQYLTLDRGRGLPNITDYPQTLDLRPPLHGYQIAPRSVPRDPPKYGLTLVPRTDSNPFKVRIDLAPGYSTYNINTGGSNNAFGAKLKLSAIGKLSDRWTIGAFASFEAETEQYTRKWTPSSQAGIAGFVAYEILPDVFFGVQARSWVAYEHLLASRPVAHTTMVGPSLAWKFGDDAILTVSYTPQISRNGAKSDLARQSRFNADVFDNHPLGFKLKFRF